LSFNSIRVSLKRDECSAIFASVYDFTLIFCFDLFKFSPPHTINLLALRAITAPKLFFVNGEVAISAADFFCLLYQDKVFVLAGCHRYEDTGLHF
jgi:hypothetical protein